MSEAQSIIDSKPARASGFRVHFERLEGCIGLCDFFPARDEPAIDGETEAWGIAAEFARAAPANYVDIYVIRACDFVPVEGYEAQMLRRKRAVTRA